MNSRSQILKRIHQNKPGVQHAVNLDKFYTTPDEQELLANFCSNVLLSDGRLVNPGSIDELPALLQNEIDGRSVVDFSGYLPAENGPRQLNHLADKSVLDKIQVLVFQSALGVAENGALWWDEAIVSQCRVLPFIVEKTIVLVEKKSIVPTMHHAYDKLGRLQTGFGAFLAGPSKTGDIEQTLVTGAHGALSHVVVLI